jgi:hypothetical protein
METSRVWVTCFRVCLSLGVQPGDGPEPSEIEQAIRTPDIARLEAELAHKQAQGLLRHRRIHLEPDDDRRATPSPEYGLDGGHHVILALVDVEVRVAGHAKRRVLDDLHSRKQSREVPRDQLLEGYESLTVRQHHETRQ